MVSEFWQHTYQSHWQTNSCHLEQTQPGLLAIPPGLRLPEITNLYVYSTTGTCFLQVHGSPLLIIKKTRRDDPVMYEKSAHSILGNFFQRGQIERTMSNKNLISNSQVEGGNKFLYGVFFSKTLIFLHRVYI